MTEEKRLNVRCCCTPQKILGTLPAPEEGQTSRVFLYRTAGLLRLEVRTFAQRSMCSPELLKRAADPVVAKLIAAVNTNEPAYYSDDTPLEHLLLITEFREGEKV